MSTNRVCKLSANCFCDVCGYYISLQQARHKMMPETNFFTAYKAYFGMKMGDQDKLWGTTLLLR